MNHVINQSHLILANDLTVSEQEALASCRFRSHQSDILVWILPKVPVQFYLLPSVQYTVQQQHLEHKHTLKKLGHILNVEQQVFLDANFWQNELIHLAAQNHISNILVGKKWSSLLYLGWWYKHYGIRLQAIDDVKDEHGFDSSIAA